MCQHLGMGTAPSALDTGLLRRMRLARDAMDRDWAEPLDVAAVAARAGYSRYHFVRLFSDVYGETPAATWRGAGSSAPRTCCAPRTSPSPRSA